MLGLVALSSNSRLSNAVLGLGGYVSAGQRASRRRPSSRMSLRSIDALWLIAMPLGTLSAWLLGQVVPSWLYWLALVGCAVSVAMLAAIGGQTP